MLPSPYLSPAQRRARDLIVSHGYAVSMIFTDRAYYLLCGGVRIQYRVVDALRRQRVITGLAVPPGQTAHGFANRSRTSAHIVVPVTR